VDGQAHQIGMAIAATRADHGIFCLQDSLVLVIHQGSTERVIAVLTGVPSEGNRHALMFEIALILGRVPLRDRNDQPG
jgi:hypothetical protein